MKHIGHPPHPTAFHSRNVRCPLLLLLALLLLFTLSSRSGELTVFVANNDTDAQNQPKAGQGPWLPLGNGPRGLKLNPTQSIWLACNNNLNDGEYKRWTLTLTSLGNPADVNDKNLVPTAQDGFDEKGAKCFEWHFSGFDQNLQVRKLYVCFKPQPVWERVKLQNNSPGPITFTVTAVNACLHFQTVANTVRVPTCFFGAVGPGVMLTNQLITEVMVFPQTVAIDPSSPPNFSAPYGTGNWTASTVYEDPDGNLAPLGGVAFTCDGPGLAPGQPCGLSLAMQGPADMQYKMYAYDSVLQEFQDFACDLRPSLTINNSNNSIGLHFNSVQGQTYAVQTSPDLNNWQARQSFPGTGDILTWQTPMQGPVGFFRVACQAAPIVTNLPAVIGLSAPIFSNVLTVTFSEPVDDLTAADPANYFIFGDSGTIPIQGVAPAGSRAVQLLLESPLLPFTNYFLGVTGITDPAGDVMAPTNFPFQAESLQTPCPGGTLLARQTYSECNSDGFWHVVEDDSYQCPPDGAVQSFRVADTQTTQPCSSSQTPPNPVGLLYCTDADVVPTCQAFTDIGPMNVCTCAGGSWSASSYEQYQCQDGTPYLRGPIQTAPMLPSTPCNQPPPSPIGQINCTHCQIVGFLGQVHVVPECWAGLWSDDTYNQYQCADGTTCLSGPVASVVLNPPTPCDQPPPSH